MATIEDVFEAMLLAEKSGNMEDATKIAQYLNDIGYGPRQKVEAPLPKKRTWGEAGADIAASLGAGLGQLAQVPGQVGMLAGLYKPEEAETGLQGLGMQLQQYAQERKSPILQAREAERAQKIGAEQGILNEARVALASTVTDPALLTSFFAEQVPNLIGSFGIGAFTKGGTKLLMRNATKEALEKAGVSGAVGGNAVMQGADIGSDTYEETLARLKKEQPGIDPAKAQEIALSAGRKAAIEAAAISLGTTMLPGGATIEKALVGRGLPGGAGLVKGALGEAVSEGLEEAGGALAKNISMAEVVPGVDITKGVGAAGALGALGGALFGGPAGLLAGGPQPQVPPPTVTPGAQPPAAAPEAVTPEAPRPTGGLTAEQANTLRQEAEQLEQMRQEAVAQKRMEEAARLEAEIRARQERIATMPGFATPAGNADITGAIEERRQAAEQQARAEASAADLRRQQEAADAEQERLRRIEEIKNTKYASVPSVDERIKRQLLSELEGAKPPLEEPAGLFPEGEPVEKEPVTAPKKVGRYKYSAEDQEQINSLKAEIDAATKEITAAKKEKGNLFKELEGKLIERPGAINLADIDPDNKKLRKLYNTKGVGAVLEDKVADGSLDAYLPPDNRSDNPSFDSQAAVEHIAQKLKTGDYTSEIEAANIEAAERRRSEAQQQLDKLTSLPEVEAELEQRRPTAGMPSIDDLVASASNAGIDVERVKEDIARQMPDATQAQYNGALYNTLSAAVSESATYTINGQDYTRSEIETLIGERFTEDEINELIARAEAQQKPAPKPTAPPKARGETVTPPGGEGAGTTAEQVTKRAAVAIPSASRSNKALAEAVDDNDWGRVTDALSKSKNPLIANVGRMAEKLVGLTTQVSPSAFTGKRRNWIGFYRPMEGSIYVKSKANAANEWVVAHETVHALTYDAIHNPTKEQRPAINRLNNLYRYVKTQLGARGRTMYGLTSMDEFIAEGNSNPEFQKELSKIRYQNQTAWGAFTKTIADLLGIKDQSALTELMALTEELTSAPARTGKGEDIGVKAPWGEREAPDSYGRRLSLTRMYNRMQDAYDESFSLDEAYNAAYKNATKPEQYILRELKKDDFLGFDYPHQAIEAIIESPDSFDMSTGLKTAISRLGNRELGLFGSKEAPPVRTKTGEDAMEILNGMGRSVKEPEPGYVKKTQEAWDNARDNPKLAKEQAMGTFRRWVDQFETWAFSSDAGLNNQIRKEIMDSMIGQEEKIGILLNASLSQTVHSDAVANLFLTKGNIKYDKELHKWVGVDDSNNIVNLSRQLDEIAEKHGLTKEEIELIAHTAFEAKRTQSLMRENERIESEAEAMRAEARRIRSSSPVAASELLEKANRHLKKIKTLQFEGADLDAFIKGGMTQFELFPELNKVVQTWDGVRKNALDTMVETGLYSREEAENLMANADYVPFFREDQIEGGKGPKEFLRSLSVQADKRMKGSKKPVNDIFDNMVRWTQYAINRGVRNRSAQALVDTAESVGLAKKAASPKDGENVVRVWRDGQEQYYSMEDPMFVSAFRGLESVSIPTVKFFSKFADILRSSVVLFPTFAVSQITQDSFAAMYTSGLKPQYALTIPMRAVKEFVQTLRGKSKIHEELKNVGAVGVRDFTSSVIRADFEIMAGLKKDKSLWDSVKRKLNNVAMAADNAVRQATYEAAIAQGVSRAEAIEKAFEIFNVRRRGSSQMLSMAGQVIPFFNAYLAAQNVAYRTLTGVGTSPTQRKAALQTLAATTASVMALSTLYAMMMGDDEDYEKKPTPTRDRLLMIPGTGGFGIPLRADAFLLPKVLAEHTYQLLSENGMTDPAKFRASVASLLANSILSPTPVPQAVKPIAESILNYDFFQQKPLVGIYQSKKDVSRQFEDSTSELAKLFGKTELISPIVVDHLVRGMFGSFGGAFLLATNPLIAAMAGTTRPDMSLRDAANAIPSASTFISKEYEAGLRKDFYALKEVTDRAASTLADLKNRSPHEIQEYLSDPVVKQRIGMSPVINRIATQLTEIRKKVNTITNIEDPKMTPARKEELIRQLREQEYQLLKNVNLRRLREMANM